ncbi:MAG: hypothetical protein KDI44_16420 [Thiothrix sp.]|nr:hypothetical protein [Thiothrix sp.]
MAELCNLSVSELIRRQMAGIKIESNEQAQQFLVLAKINADLGRLGGLLKLWLSDPGKEQQGRKLEIPTLINQIKSTQGLLAQTARELATRQ